MCLIIASPHGRKPSFEVFEDAARVNSHGIGFAWKDKDKILFKKGLELDEFKKLLDAAPKEWIAHFRIATVGGQVAELTHPFIVSNDSPLVLEGEADALLFQNGTYGSWSDELLKACLHFRIRIPDGEWSDTRAMAVLVSLYGKNILRFIGSHSRYVLFTNGDKKSPDRQTVMWQTGSWEKHAETGLWFSNRSNCIFHPPTESFGGGTRRPFVEPAASIARPDTGKGVKLSLMNGRQTSGGGKRKRTPSSVRSPWQFFGASGGPERDGIAEALGVPLDAGKPEVAAGAASIQREE